MIKIQKIPEILSKIGKRDSRSWLNNQQLNPSQPNLSLSNPLKFPHLANRIKPKVSHAKPRKPLQKSIKPIAKKARFDAQSNPIKAYRQKRPQEEVDRYAERCRAIRLAEETGAEAHFARILDGERIPFEREKIIFYAKGQRFLLADFYIPHGGQGVIFEIDGGVHAAQRRYDKGRDSYCEEHGIRTYRFTNDEVLKHREKITENLRKIMVNK